jgi:hypothetical protein
MTTKVRQILNQLEEVLIVGDRDARDTWDILSALRGPDEGQGKHFTVRVRREAFPRIGAKATSADFNIVMSLGALFAARDAASYTEELPIGGHFNKHLGAAVQALERQEA